MSARQLAAFCVCWFDGKDGQIEPLGVGEAYRGLGLGKALLTEGFRRLRALGAEKIHVETDDYRDAAFSFYYEDNLDTCVADRVSLAGQSRLFTGPLTDGSDGQKLRTQTPAAARTAF